MNDVDARKNIEAMNSPTVDEEVPSNTAKVKAPRKIIEERVAVEMRRRIHPMKDFFKVYDYAPWISSVLIEMYADTHGDVPDKDSVVQGVRESNVTLFIYGDSSKMMDAHAMFVVNVRRVRNNARVMETLDLLDSDLKSEEIFIGCYPGSSWIYDRSRNRDGTQKYPLIDMFTDEFGPRPQFDTNGGYGQYRTNSDIWNLITIEIQTNPPHKRALLLAVSCDFPDAPLFMDKCHGRSIYSNRRPTAVSGSFEDIIRHDFECP